MSLLNCWNWLHWINGNILLMWNRGEKDRLDLNRTDQWMMRLTMADPERLVEWLYSDGQGLAYYYLYRSIVVEAMEGNDLYDVAPNFFTIDGLFYIRALREDQRETIEKLLRTMADKDLLKYHALLMGMAGVLPAESEEDMLPHAKHSPGGTRVSSQG